MATITTRAGKGSALTWNEVDANFSNLNNEVHPASSITNTPAGGIEATTVQAAINELDADKAAVPTAATAAATGNSQATTTTVVTANVTTISSATVSTEYCARLKTATAGDRLIVGNTTAISVRIFPATGDSIGAQAANGHIILRAGSVVEFICDIAGHWWAGYQMYQEAAYIQGVVDVSRGGTGATTLTGLVKGNGTSAMTAAVAGTDYQAPLVSGTNIRTVNGNTLLGSTDLVIAGGVSSVNGATGAVTVQDVLVSGTNIRTVNGNSLLGSTDLVIASAGYLDGGVPTSTYGGITSIDGGTV